MLRLELVKIALNGQSGFLQLVESLTRDLFFKEDQLDLVPGEIKSWWLGGLRSGPPSCVNQAIQTVMITATMIVTTTMATSMVTMV